MMTCLPTIAEEYHDDEHDEVDDARMQSAKTTSAATRAAQVMDDNAPTSHIVSVTRLAKCIGYV